MKGFSTCMFADVSHCASCKVLNQAACLKTRKPCSFYKEGNYEEFNEKVEQEIKDYSNNHSQMSQTEIKAQLDAKWSK